MFCFECLQITKCKGMLFLETQQSREVRINQAQENKIRQGTTVSSMQMIRHQDVQMKSPGLHAIHTHLTLTNSETQPSPSLR